MPFLIQDITALLLNLGLTFLAVAVGLYLLQSARLMTARLLAKESQERTWLERLLSMGRQNQMMILTAVCLALAFVSNTAMILLLIKKSLTAPIPETVVALVGNFNGAVTTACIVTPIAYWFGSSNGSQLKDEKKPGVN
jgi:hypothetical protein